MTTAVLVHSTERSFEQAWPFAPVDARSCEVDAEAPMDAQGAAVASATLGASAVFGHSALAIAALRGSHEIDLVLAEPAFYDLARGDAAIEAHIAAVSMAREKEQAGDLEGWWRIIRPLMFGGPFDPERWHDERPLAERFARRIPPWGHGITPAELRGRRMLVVTGGWNDEYEAIAAVLVSLGAHHVILEGHQHRPQDHPDFAPAVEEFLR